MNDYWNETRHDVNRAGWLGVKWVIVAVLLVITLSTAIWFLTVAASDVKGKGDAYSQKNSAENWVEAQAEFNQRYQDILATDRKIGPAKTALDADPNNAVLQTNYTGLVNYCQDEVGKYNSMAREYLSKDFRDADLPAEISSTNPATDCK